MRPIKVCIMRLSMPYACLTPTFLFIVSSSIWVAMAIFIAINNVKKLNRYENIRCLLRAFK